MFPLIANFQRPLLAMQLPELPAGPSLENVRGPIEAAGGSGIAPITLAALVVLLMVGFFVWRYLRSRQRSATPIDPQTAAMAELDAATQAADDERFALLCAGALRRFIAARFDLPASSQTSAELCAHLRLKGEDNSRIPAFLERCDGVKFARQTLTPHQRIEILDTARDLITGLKVKETPAA
jgi:hypothetical protein